MIPTVAPASTEMLPPAFTPISGGVDPGVIDGWPPMPLPPYHPHIGNTVSQAEFNALEARVAALEATP